MSSSDRKTVLSRRALLVSFAALPLGGCLRPMYGSASVASGSAGSELAAIDVVPIGERLGHYLTEDLRFALHGGTPASQWRYRLEVTIVRSVVTPIVDTQTGRADVATTRGEAFFKLTAYEGGPILVDGRATGSASYDRLTQRYAGMRAGVDSEKRIAETIADQIRTRLAAYFADKK
jgi:LPS-assembly lipoprotein